MKIKSFLQYLIKKICDNNLFTALYYSSQKLMTQLKRRRTLSVGNAIRVRNMY